MYYLLPCHFTSYIIPTSQEMHETSELGYSFQRFQYFDGTDLNEIVDISFSSNNTNIRIRILPDQLHFFFSTDCFKTYSGKDDD